MKIEYTVKNVYGTDRNYAKEQSVAEAVEKLTGQKTLSDAHLSALVELGHTIERVL